MICSVGDFHLRCKNCGHESFYTFEEFSPKEDHSAKSLEFGLFGKCPHCENPFEVNISISLKDGEEKISPVYSSFGVELLSLPKIRTK